MIIADEPVRGPTAFITLAVGAVLLVGLYPRPGHGDSARAYQHLYEVMDQYHQSFDVYTDLSAAGNHFIMLGKLSSSGDEDRVVADPGCSSSPHLGATCIENRFTAAGDNWGGYYFMNGVLQADEAQPKANWGTSSNAGVNLNGATQLTFWARGQDGGERVEFFAFGVGRDPYTGIPTEPYPDSSPKRTLGHVTLNNTWAQYSIDLTGTDLSYVLGGFAWVTNAPNNGNRDVAFYLDDMPVVVMIMSFVQRRWPWRCLVRVSYGPVSLSQVQFCMVQSPAPITPRCCQRML